MLSLFWLGKGRERGGGGGRSSLSRFALPFVVPCGLKTGPLFLLEPRVAFDRISGKTRYAGSWTLEGLCLLEVFNPPILIVPFCVIYKQKLRQNLHQSFDFVATY